MSRRRSVRIVALLTPIGLASSSFAQTLGQAVDPPTPWWRIAIVLAFCLALAVGAALALRARLGGASRPALQSPFASLVSGLRLLKPGPGVVSLVETVRLSHQIDICLIRWRENELLVAATAQGVVLLGQQGATATSGGDVE
jgi:hypothetical protein